MGTTVVSSFNRANSDFLVRKPANSGIIKPAISGIIEVAPHSFYDEADMSS
jgi:hypothetical protein